MNTAIQTTKFPTPLGDMVACATGQGICLLEFVGSRRIGREQQDLQRLLNLPLRVGGNIHLEQCADELREYFSGGRTTFEVALHTPGTPFQNTTWQALRQIPYGETVSYREQATRMGKPSAVRAVANANGQNRISIIIPCHRVIGADGSLTGYGGGLQRKQWLLEHEGGMRAHGRDLFGDAL
ncbi:MAG: methylated-DNA--[protein]-cysteine S-methyltransferase [Neisseria sp.]|nr:methylated-DNA--[protein]-cysteine S-methyltransferase [Neisseria sp.]